MKMNKKFLILSLIGILAAGGIWMISTGFAFATASTPKNAFISQIAQKLGISDQKLSSAIEETAFDNISLKLKKGEITLTQAMEMKQDVREGRYNRFGMENWENRDRDNFNAFKSLAGYLGIPSPELRNELKSGRKLSDIIISHGKTVVMTKTYLLQQASLDIQKKVTSKKITQKIADKKIATLSTRIDTMLNDNEFFLHNHKLMQAPNSVTPTI